MGGLLISLVPVGCRLVLSPVAILALLAVLLSHQVKTNGMAFLLGWTAGLVGVLGFFVVGSRFLDVHARSQPPGWVPFTRIALAVVFLISAVMFGRQGRSRREQMAHATNPADVRRAAGVVLPKRFADVRTFTPARTLVFGFGFFVLAPIRWACCAIAALDLGLADVPDQQTRIAGLLFCIAGIVPVALPVALALRDTDRVGHQLRALRGWLATKSGYVNAALMMLIAVIQLVGGLRGLSGA